MIDPTTVTGLIKGSQISSKKEKGSRGGKKDGIIINKPSFGGLVINLVGSVKPRVFNHGPR